MARIITGCGKNPTEDPTVNPPLNRGCKRASAAWKVRIRADKFSPPQFNPAQLLNRERLIVSLLRQNASRNGCIVVEAQPGLGKTTVIEQFLDRSDIASIWYRVDEDDTDPGYFLQAIPACLNTLWPDYPSVATTRILASGDLTPYDIPKRLEPLIADLHECLSAELYLVFDDLHNLLPHPDCLFILNTLLQSAPSTLRFILISREPLVGLDALSNMPYLIRLDNTSLAMDEQETTDLLHQIHHLDVSLQQIREIVHLTGGWTMGVRLMGLYMEECRGLIDSSVPIDLKTGGWQACLDYFGTEVLTLLDESIHTPLLVLALIDEIPIKLARDLTGRPDIRQVLEELTRRNFFLTSLASDGTLFCLHHLFQLFLRNKARTELEEQTILQAYAQAGTFYLAQDNPTQAIHYYILAEEYQQLEAILREYGMVLLAANRTATLGSLLRRIPEKQLGDMGWSSLVLALTFMDSMPSRALPMLDLALTIFAERGDEVGELLSLSHSISARIITTGHYSGGERLLDRAVFLFSRRADSLDTATTILVARNLAMGYCIFLADTDEANRYGSLALALARKEQLANFEAALLMVMGYIRIFAGHSSLARMYLEQATLFVHHVEVGIFNRLAIRMMLFNYLLHNGDFYNYFEQKHQMIDVFGLDLVAQSIAGPFCFIWEMDIALNKGDLATALKLADQALAQHPPFSPHLTSQILQLKGVALALTGQADQALADADESCRLRELAGGPYFISLNKLLVGLIRGLCGLHQQGLALLDEGIADARRMPTEYLEACGLLHRSEVLLAAGNDKAARNDLESGMRLLHRNGYRHFWAWHPVAMTRSLTRSVQYGYEPAFARTLAAERLHLSLLDDGTAIPHLEIHVLGGIRVSRQGIPILEAEALTPLQRELLALLLAAPGLKLPQESICLHFWPESPQDTVRIKFDTLISRLRKTLAESLSDNTASFYLNREKGMLWLAHCRIDSHMFVDGVKQGMMHYRLQEFWQAGNMFAAIAPLWQGEFAPGVAGDDRVRHFRDSLNASLSEMALAWSDLLVRSNRLADAISVVNKALFSDPFNDRLYSLLYRLEGQRSAVHARRILDRFKSVLQQEGFCDSEITELVHTIASSPTGHASLYR